jgi:LAS superfamily LD-carboxypeptidase LdcB
MLNKIKNRQKYLIVIVLVLAILGIAVGGYFYYQTNEGVKQNILYLENKIFELENENIALGDALVKEQQKNNDFSSQIGQLAGTVGRLDQLSKTDKELLQKYSKIYFLNENYVPENLVDIPADYVAEKGKEIKFHTKAFPYLQMMIVSAKSAGINLQIISGYRSFGEQSALKDSYKFYYGSGANKFSADQGYSEHQLGTAIDFTTANLGLNFDSFEKTDGYKWLLENAYKYGFIPSYPKGNSYYMFEPWHFRFVGKSLANMLHQEGKNFYDIDQRTIDNYLITIFN